MLVGMIPQRGRIDDPEGSPDASQLQPFGVAEMIRFFPTYTHFPGPRSHGVRDWTQTQVEYEKCLSNSKTLSYPSVTQIIFPCPPGNFISEVLEDQIFTAHYISRWDMSSNLRRKLFWGRFSLWSKSSMFLFLMAGAKSVFFAHICISSSLQW